MHFSSHSKVKKVCCRSLKQDPEALLSALCSEFVSEGGSFVLFKKPFERQIEGFFSSSEDYFRVPLSELSDQSQVFTLHPFEHSSEGCYLLSPLLHIRLNQYDLSYTCRKGTYRKWQSFFSKPPSNNFVLPSEKSDVLLDRKPLSRQLYGQLVQKALSCIEEKKLQKVVLSRCKEVKHQKHPIRLFKQLTELYGHTFTYILSTPDLGVWIGASPELLLKQKDHKIESMALAATRSVPTPPSVHEFKWSSKECKEQQFVQDYISALLAQMPSIELQKSYTETIRTGDLLHLCTFFSAHVTEQEERAIELLQHLHPTPALCGHSSKEALEFIQAHEPTPRELYGGFLGPIYAPNDYQMYVNIRSARLYDRKAFVYAGAGIVAGSMPYKEWLETELKVHTIAQLLHT